MSLLLSLSFITPDSVYTSYLPYILIGVGIIVVTIGAIVSFRKDPEEKDVAEHETYLHPFDPLRMPNVWFVPGSTLAVIGLIIILFNAIN